MRFSLTMILGLSLVLLSGVARAETPTSFEINHSANGDFFGESFSLNYTFGTTDFLDGNVTDQAPGAFPVEVNSGLGSGGFDFEVVLDYTDYGIGTFGGTSGPVTGSFVVLANRSQMFSSRILKGLSSETFALMALLSFLIIR